MLGVATHVVHVPGPDEGHVSRDDEGEERVEALGGPVVEPRAAVRHRHAYQAAAAHLAHIHLTSKWGRKLWSILVITFYSIFLDYITLLILNNTIPLPRKFQIEWHFRVNVMNKLSCHIVYNVRFAWDTSRCRQWWPWRSPTPGARGTPGSQSEVSTVVTWPAASSGWSPGCRRSSPGWGWRASACTRPGDSSATRWGWRSRCRSRSGPSPPASIQQLQTKVKRRLAKISQSRIKAFSWLKALIAICYLPG